MVSNEKEKFKIGTLKGRYRQPLRSMTLPMTCHIILFFIRRIQIVDNRLVHTFFLSR